MARISLGGFKDPARRPRYIIWTGIGVLLMAIVMIAALGITSSYWFCANGCHKVQDDTITAYNASTHNKVSCMACHMPVNASPVTFMLHKAEALGELYLTITGSYEIPLNGESHVAMEMPSGQCNQCHPQDRVATPSMGMLIDHDVHAEEGINCTLCHNRVAHADQNIEFVNVDPTTGEPNYPHDDFMTMTACFRCHSQEADSVAPGDCAVCHTPGFPLKPSTHDVAGFYEPFGESAGHAELARAAAEETSGSAEATETETEKAEEGHGESEWDLPSVSEINYCSTCHSEQFCTDCHGVPMPHPADFNEGHGEEGRTRAEVCAKCHAQSAETAGSLEFCDSCHHPTSDPTRTWISQHFEIVQQTGAQPCFDCHNPTYCAQCHVRGSTD